MSIHWLETFRSNWEALMEDEPVTHRVAASSQRTLCCGVALDDLAPDDVVSSSVERTTCRPGKRIA